MAIKPLDAIKERIGAKVPAIPPPRDIMERKVRAERRIDQGMPMRNLCLRFYRNQQYWYINEQGVLNLQPTTTYINGGGKPRHRVRTTRNWITPLIESKISAATQRVPSYEVNPSSFDPDRIQAAELAKKVAVYGYDKWKVKRATVKAATLALVADEAFAWPYWDSTIGPFAEVQSQDGSKTCVGLGDVSVRVMSRNEVGWEPGMDFEESPYYVVRQARTVEQVKSIEGFMGGELTPDATADTRSLKRQQARELVLVTDYLERPSAKYPKGRWITIANSRVIAGLALTRDAETGEPTTNVRGYPLVDAKGAPLDEPVLHKLTYIIDADSDEDLGLVRFLIDAQRTYNDLWNKSLEWKNRVLNPRIMAPAGSMKTRPDDTPGGIDYYVPVGGQIPQWEKPPEVPQSLFTLMDQTRNDMQMIANSQMIPTQGDQGDLEVFIEQIQAHDQSFYAALSDWHSRLMRHCLILVQNHYTEPRLLKIRGRFGWESIPSFKGADLMGQDDVRVFAGSIEPLTRGDIEKRLTFLVNSFPGQLSMEQAMAALERGTAEDLIKSYELDVARANRVIQRIKSGPEALFGDAPQEGEPVVTETPWMPRPFDNIAIHKQVFEDFMKSDEYESLEPGMQEAANHYYEALQMIEQQKQMQQAAAQNAMAESLGMANAAKPQGIKPQPNIGSPLANVPQPNGPGPSGPPGS